MGGGGRAEFRFYAELNDLLPRHKRFRTFTRTFDRTATVKDMIEAEGVPHTEVDLVLANGEPVGYDYIVRDGDRIAVYPVFEAFDVGAVTRVRPEPLREPTFIADVHLGGLVRLLRLLGFDTRYERDWNDEELARRSREEHRILLTRDVGLLKRRAVTHGLFVRERDPRAQIVEVACRLQLRARFNPFTRCLECNAALRAVPKAVIAHRLDEDTRRCHSDFMRCGPCDRIYWRGSHYRRLQSLVEEIRRDLTA